MVNKSFHPTPAKHPQQQLAIAAKSVPGSNSDGDCGVE
jgi:hypothetical protein